MKRMAGLDSQEVGNIGELCRFCLKPLVNNKTKLHLYSDASQRRDIVEKARECLSIVIREEDRLSKYICFPCGKKVDNYQEFRQVCRKSENTQKQLLSLTDCEDSTLDRNSDPKGNIGDWIENLCKKASQYSEVSQPRWNEKLDAGTSVNKYGSSCLFNGFDIHDDDDDESTDSLLDDVETVETFHLFSRICAETTGEKYGVVNSYNNCSNKYTSRRKRDLGINKRKDECSSSLGWNKRIRSEFPSRDLQHNPLNDVEIEVVPREKQINIQRGMSSDKAKKSFQNTLASPETKKIIKSEHSSSGKGFGSFGDKDTEVVPRENQLSIQGGKDIDEVKKSFQSTVTSPEPKKIIKSEYASSNKSHGSSSVVDNEVTVLKEKLNDFESILVKIENDADDIFWSRSSLSASPDQKKAIKSESSSIESEVGSSSQKTSKVETVVKLECGAGEADKNSKIDNFIKVKSEPIEDDLHVDENQTHSKTDFSDRVTQSDDNNKNGSSILLRGIRPDPYSFWSLSQNVIKKEIVGIFGVSDDSDIEETSDKCSDKSDDICSKTENHEFEEEIKRSRNIPISTENNVSRLKKPMFNLQWKQHMQHNEGYLDCTQLVDDLKKKPTSCPVCAVGFKTEPEVVRHLHSHPKVQFFYCQICGEDFLVHLDLMQHITSHEMAKGKRGMCSECKLSIPQHLVKSHRRCHYLFDFIKCERDDA